jgi:xylan 1,4-beta-xylosidase
MADLARLLQSEKIHVDYWELTNEMDTAYEKAGRLPDLWRLVNKCVLAVKKVDPKAKAGGPALTWPKPEWVEGLFRNCGQNLDFVTWHNYASGDIYDSNEQVLGKADVIAGMAQSVVDAAKKFAPGKKFEMFLTEHNIKWVWEPIERRHGNNIGALFQASTIRRLAPTGIDGATVWHVKGNAYGLIGGDNTIRSTGHLFTWSKYLHGQVLASTSADETALELLPIVQADGSRSLLLLAKADRAVEVDAARLLGGRKWTAQRIDSAGLREKVEFPAAGQWSLPGYSVTLLRSVGR